MMAVQNIKFAPNTCIFWEGEFKNKKNSKTLYPPDDLIKL